MHIILQDMLQKSFSNKAAHGKIKILLQISTNLQKRLPLIFQGNVIM